MRSLKLQGGRGWTALVKAYWTMVALYNHGVAKRCLVN
jgi:hypothetical protein